MSYIFTKTKDINNNHDFAEKIEVSSVSDDLDINNLMDLFRQFLLACGYSPEVLAEWFD